VNYRWSNVAIGGGGYVTGLVIHPREPGVVYVRTDIGGCYRWQEDATCWTPITDHFRRADSGFFGGESIALDPSDSDVVFIAVGMGYDAGTVFKSTDRGRRWCRSDLSTPMHGNGDLRWAGERLAVDPFDADHVLFGSRSEGLHRSTDGGMSWERIGWTGATSPTDGIGILGILFDPSTRGTVYANTYAEGIHASTDGGRTWLRLEGSPSGVLQMRINTGGTLYTAGRQPPKVARRIRDGDWADITPLKFRLDRSAPTSTQMVLASFNFNAICTDPGNPDHLVLGIDYKMPGKLFRSVDAGTSWVEVGKHLNKTVPWWQDNYWGGSMAALAIDPHAPDRVWFTDWFGVWRTEHVRAERPTWTALGLGMEEIVATALVAPPAAPDSSGYLLMSGAMDICGLLHHDLDAFPAAKMHPVYQDTWDIDYCAGQPWHIVRVGENRAMNFLGDYVVSTESDTYGGAVSADEGRTWQRFKAMPPLLHRPTNVAMSATDPGVILVCTGHHAFRTEDGGASWCAVDSLQGPGRSGALAADRMEGSTFYCWNQGKLTRSTDGGVHFERVDTDLPDEPATLQTVHGVRHEVWIGFPSGGLHRSLDGGTCFSRIDTVDHVVLFCLGKPPAPAAPPVLFLYGAVGGSEGVFRSVDLGVSWEDIAPTEPVGIGCNPRVMAASQQHSGLVFIGTGGRGIFYGLPA
jgi:xyloglucan-specific exo-beta-1,4-glucanase